MTAKPTTRSFFDSQANLLHRDPVRFPWASSGTSSLIGAAYAVARPRLAALAAEARVGAVWPLVEADAAIHDGERCAPAAPDPAALAALDGPSARTGSHPSINEAGQGG